MSWTRESWTSAPAASLRKGSGAAGPLISNHRAGAGPGAGGPPRPGVTPPLGAASPARPPAHRLVIRSARDLLAGAGHRRNGGQGK